MQLKRLTSSLVEWLSIFMAAIFVFAPIFYYEIYTLHTIDYSLHIRFAKVIISNPESIPNIGIAHAEWNWLVYLFHQLVGHTWNFSAFFITLSSVVTSVLVLFWLLKKNLSPLLAGALAIGLLLFGPIAALFPVDHLLLPIGGYIWTNPYHNPTILLLKPFAILQLYYSVEALLGRKYNWKGILLAALISGAAAYAKPNYIICLLPAIFIIALFRLWKKQSINWKTLIIGIALPSLALLVWQFILSFGPNPENNNIVIAPFAVMKYYSSFLLPKFLLSSLFPIIVTCVFWKEAVKDIKMQIGWLGFIFGSIFTYFFAESQSSVVIGSNFIWCGEITLFILFICCTIFLSEKKLSQKNIVERWLILSSGFLHIVIGISVYYFILFN